MGARNAPDGRQANPAARHANPAVNGPVPADAAERPDKSPTEEYWEQGRDPEAQRTAREANDRALGH